MYDVAVIGSGPSGSTAAYRLAKTGLRVVLLEKEGLPRYKPCGGVVATHVDNILDFSLEPVIENKISRILITVNLQGPFVSHAPCPFMYLVMRDSFDYFLAENARRAGTVIIPKSPLTSLSIQKESYLLETPSGEIRARYLVGADGANGMTRKLVGAQNFRRRLVAVEREIKAPRRALSEWGDMIALDIGSIASGYAWVFPKAGNFSIGAGGPGSLAKALVPYYEKIIDVYKEKIGNTIPYLAKAHHLPIRVPGEQLVFGRTLLVGDAAGLIEPLAGEGIYYAIRSGQMAAETIIAGLQEGDGDGVLGEYQRNIDQEIQPELQVAKSLLYLLNLAPALWVPWLINKRDMFRKHFYRIFTGERKYQDFPRKLGVFGKVFFSFLEKWIKE